MSRTVQGAAAAVAVAHVVVLLAVQAQLVTMEQRLDRIEQKLDTVLRQLDNERLATVPGRLRALKKLRDEMAASDWSETDRLRRQVALDQAETEFHQIEEFARLQCADAENQIEHARMNTPLFGAIGRTLINNLISHIERYRAHHDLLYLCMLGRFVVAYLRQGFGRQVDDEELRIDLNRARETLRRHEKLIANRAMDFTTKFMRARYETAVRDTLKDEGEAFRARSDESLQALTARLPGLHAESRARLRAVIDIDRNRKVTEVRLLHSDAKIVPPSGAERLANDDQ